MLIPRTGADSSEKAIKPQTLLALDTSTEQAAIALIVDSDRVFCSHPDPEARHGRNLVGSIQELLSEGGLRVHDLDGIVVGIGPGSYTGLRIGITAAKTLAYVGKTLLLPFDSLELLARNAPADHLRVSVIADAQRDDVYATTLERTSIGGPLSIQRPTAIESFSRWAETLAPRTFVIGPGVVASKFSERIPETAILPENPRLHFPDARNLSRFAVEIGAAGVTASSWFLEPAYFRRSAAEEQWEKRKQLMPEASV